MACTCDADGTVTCEDLVTYAMSVENGVAGTAYSQIMDYLTINLQCDLEDADDDGNIDCDAKDWIFDDFTTFSRCCPRCPTPEPTARTPSPVDPTPKPTERVTPAPTDDVCPNGDYWVTVENVCKWCTCDADGVTECD